MVTYQWKLTDHGTITHCPNENNYRDLYRINDQRNRIDGSLPTVAKLLIVRRKIIIFIFIDKTIDGNASTEVYRPWHDNSSSYQCDLKRR